MIFLFLSLIFSSKAVADNLDQKRWYLNPHGQEVAIDLSDTVTEKIYASPELDYGFSKLSKYKLSKKVKVAIIDGGIDKNHSIFQNSLAYKKQECEEETIIGPMKSDHDQNGFKNDCLGWNFSHQDNRVDDEDGHGTHVAGIIKTFFRFHPGHLKILPLKIFTEKKQDRILPRKIFEAFSYAIQENVDLIHLSMGWPTSLMSVRIKDIIKKALDKGILVVAAAGNSAQRANIYPCKIQGVICVGALRANGQIASFSNFGSQVDFLAPGEKILSSIPHFVNPLYIPIRGYDYKNGTSQAAPFISGAALFLKSFEPKWDSLEVYTKLLMSASPAKKALRSMIHIPKGIKATADKIIPELKELGLIKRDNQKTISVYFQNASRKKTLKGQVSLRCLNSQEKKEIQLKPRERKALKFSIFSPQNDQLNCELEVNKEHYLINFKVLSKPIFSSSYEVLEKNMVKPARSKVISNFRTIPAIPGKMPQAFYYKRSKNNSFEVFYKNKKLGLIEDKKNCKRLRTWQYDLNKDNETDFLVEYLCNKKELEYHFLDQKLSPLFPAASFVPKYTIINYKKFELITHEDKVPEFLFINMGFSEESRDPWDSNGGNRKNDLYRVQLVQGKYQEVSLSKPEKWQKDLGFRFVPEVRIRGLVSQEKYLVEIERQKYFADVETGELTRAGLDHVLLSANKADKVFLSDEKVFHNLITPYDYSAAFINGRVLKYQHSELSDPIIKPLGLIKTDDGYEVYLKTFSHILKLHFDFLGNIISQSKSPVERFDFLDGEELDSTTYPVFVNNTFKIIVDGTRIHTNYITVIGRSSLSLDLGKTCVAQSPVDDEGKIRLAVACYEKDKQYLKMIDL